MSSTQTEETCTTRTITQTVVDLFLTIKSGLKTPLASPGRKRCKNRTAASSPKSPPKYRSLASDSQSIQKLQLQRRKSKLRAKKHKLEEQSTSSSKDDTDEQHSQKSRSSSVTYEDMAKQRIGVDGPVNPYDFAKVKLFFGVPDDSSSMAETISSYNCRSLSTSERSLVRAHEDQKLVFEFLKLSDIDLILELTRSWTSSIWSKKRIGFRALIVESFRNNYRALENEVRQFSSDSKEIQDYLKISCHGIFYKQKETCDFLQYTKIYALMFEPIENDMYNIEYLVDCDEEAWSGANFERLENDFAELKQSYSSLPEFDETSLSKRMISESNLHRLNQFCTLVGDHRNHVERIEDQFNYIRFHFADNEHLMRDYIMPIRNHFEKMREGISKPSWLKVFGKFRFFLERSNRENHEANQMMNTIISRRTNVDRSEKYIGKRLHYSRTDLARLSR